MTSTQVVETSVNVITNSPSQDYTHPDDHTLPTYNMTPGSNHLQCTLNCNSNVVNLNLGGEKPGRVSVTITKLTGEYLGETVYTYIDGRRDESEKVLSNKRQLADLFDKMAKRLKGDDSAGNETQDSQQQG